MKNPIAIWLITFAAGHAGWFIGDVMQGNIRPQRQAIVGTIAAAIVATIAAYISLRRSA